LRYEPDPEKPQTQTLTGDTTNQYASGIKKTTLNATNPRVNAKPNYKKKGK